VQEESTVFSAKSGEGRTDQAHGKFRDRGDPYK
jgi:hypothetical protein